MKQSCKSNLTVNSTVVKVNQSGCFRLRYFQLQLAAKYVSRQASTRTRAVELGFKNLGFQVLKTQFRF